MDLYKIHEMMQNLNEKVRHGGRITPEERVLMEDIRSSPMVDRMDAKVLVRYPHFPNPVWEEYSGITDYRSAEGEMSIVVGGTHANGEEGTVRAVCWPRGGWLKFETWATPVDNPYYEPPVGTKDFDGSAIPGRAVRDNPQA